MSMQQHHPLTSESEADFIGVNKSIPAFCTLRLRSFMVGCWHDGGHGNGRGALAAAPV